MAHKKVQYKRKTVDFWKMEVFKNGKWETILNTVNTNEYKELYNKLIITPFIKFRGRKYRRLKTENHE